MRIYSTIFEKLTLEELLIKFNHVHLQGDFISLIVNNASINIFIDFVKNYTNYYELVRYNESRKPRDEVVQSFLIFKFSENTNKRELFSLIKYLIENDANVENLLNKIEDYLNKDNMTYKKISVDTIIEFIDRYDESFIKEFANDLNIKDSLILLANKINNLDLAYILLEDERIYNHYESEIKPKIVSTF